MRRLRMQRVFAVVLVLAVIAVGGTVWAPPIPAAEDIEDQIRDAYANVLNEFVPMRERLAALEEGEKLRATLKEFDALEKVAGFKFRAVRLLVNSVRVHDGDAEVQLAIYADYYMVTGWSGVARKIDGRWVVARGTICTMLAEWTTVDCPGTPKPINYFKGRTAKARKQGNAMVVPLTFTDGDRADLVMPKDLAKGWKIIPHAEVVLDDHTRIPIYFQPGRASATQPVRTYDGAPGHVDAVLDAMYGLIVHVDEWTAFVPTETLSERERRLIARHLDGYTTASGFPVLIPNGPLAFHRPDPAPTDGASLAKSALNVDDAANPMELSYSNGDTFYVSVVITPGPCPAVLQRPYVSGEYHAEERCTANGFGRIAVEGNTDLVTRLLDELRVENYRAAPALTTA